MLFLAYMSSSEPTSEGDILPELLQAEVIDLSRKQDLVAGLAEELLGGEITYRNGNLTIERYGPTKANLMVSLSGGFKPDVGNGEILLFRDPYVPDMIRELGAEGVDAAYGLTLGMYMHDARVQEAQMLPSKLSKLPGDVPAIDTTFYFGSNGRAVASAELPSVVEPDRDTKEPLLKLGKPSPTPLTHAKLEIAGHALSLLKTALEKPKP